MYHGKQVTSACGRAGTRAAKRTEALAKVSAQAPTRQFGLVQKPRKALASACRSILFLDGKATGITTSFRNEREARGWHILAADPLRLSVGPGVDRCCIPACDAHLVSSAEAS